ncbi:gliding motility-associated C-terminal domain-containing protein, partial [Tenacibaculum finnmarkense]
GTYEVTYEICENGANPANCKSNTATVLVENPLVANIDDFTGTPLTIGDPSPSVIADDTLDGAAVVIGTNPGQVTLNGTTVPSEVTLNSDGTITVNAGAPSGTYEVTYEICENGANPANCKSNTATVLVENLLLADNDTLGTALVPLASGVNPVAAGSVLTGDTLNGVQVTTVNTDITPVTSGNILIDADGNVTIAANTPTGFYPVIYTICENVANPANCTEATVTVEVVGELVAVADKFTSINGKDRATTVSVLENDTLNGEKVIPSEITLTAGTAPTPTSGSITMNADGNIIVAPGTTAGTYDYEYTICEKLNPANCSTVISKVIVEAAPIEAVADTFTSINGKEGDTITSVLDNDTLNGVKVVPSEITLTAGTAPTTASGSITMNADGSITIAPGTTAGTYDYEYTICEKLNPANCKTVTSTIEVVAAPIEAVADTFTSINGKEGNITTSVLENDTLNDVKVVPTEITLTAGTAPAPASGSITMNADGSITIAPGTTAGTYDYEYTICEKLNPSNCKTVTSTIEVVAAPIEAVKDTFTSINGKDGATTTSVLENDTLNGVKVVPSEVTLTAGTAPTPTSGSIIMNADGSITIAPGTTAGTYDYEYTICEKLNPSNCKTVTSTIEVVAAPIEAVADTFTSINGKDGATTTSVLENDTLNGVKVVPSEITLTAGTAPTPIVGSILMNTDGTITIAPGTTAGTYDYEYTICENLNPTNCKTVTSTIEVVAAPIEAEVDTFTEINGKDGAITTSVLENDTLNGVKVVPSEVTLTVVNIADDLTLNDDGTVTISPNTPAGTYQVEYSICEKLNPSNCSTVISEVVVGVPEIEAITDIIPDVNGLLGGTTLALTENDTLNGVPVVVGTAPGDVTLSAVSLPIGFILNNDGTLTVAPNTASGIYQVEYSICEVNNPTNCSVITVEIIVLPVATITPVVDDYTESPVSVGGVIDNVTANDILNGNPVVIGTADGEVTLTPDPNGTNPDGFVFDENGNITIVPDTAPGDYIIEYEICENGLVSENCEITTVKITVKPVTPIDPIVDDYNQNPTALGGTTEAVTENDTLNGNPVVVGTAVGEVTLTPDPNGTNEDGFTFNPDGTITIAPEATPGTYDLEYEICENGSNPTNCQVATVTIVVVPEANPCGTPYNIMTPDNDGENDSFFISCIDKPEYANNTVEIFNRWGNTVYKASG